LERIGSGMIVDTSNHTHYDDSQFYMKSHIIQQVRLTHEIPPHACNVQNNKKVCKIECYVNDNLHDEGRNEKLYNLHVQFFN